MTFWSKSIFALMAALLMANPAQAEWNLRTGGEEALVTRAKMAVTPKRDWNKWTLRPSKRGEIWTRDGLLLNELSFFAEIRDGEPIYRELDKKDNPLPKFKSDMLLLDIVEMFEATNRILLQTSVFELEKAEPAKLGGHDAVRFTYNYVVENDELRRKGEAVAAIVDQKLYLVNFVAPKIHYFDEGIEEFRQIARTIRLAETK